MEGDPTSFEEAMRSAHSSKWLKAMEDEMKSMKTNGVWDLETIPKEPRQQAVNGSTKPNMTPKRIQKDSKRDL